MMWELSGENGVEEDVGVPVVDLLLVAVVVQGFALERVQGCAVGEVGWRQGDLGHVAVAVGP